MSSTKSTELSQRIKILRESRGLSKAQLASLLGISGAYVTDLESGKNKKTSIPLAKLICFEFGVNSDWLLTGEGPQHRGKLEDKKEDSLIISSNMEEEYSLVPRYDVKVSAGGGAFIYGNEPILNHLAFRRDWLKGVMGLNPKKLSVITVMGDSMEPTVNAGDIVLVDHREGCFKSDGIYVVNYDGMLVVKRLQSSPTGTTIKSDNPVYKEIFISHDSQEYLKIVGRVVWLGKRV